MMKVYAQPHSKGGGEAPSTNKSADDRSYTAWAQGTASEAGIRNPVGYVNKNVKSNKPPSHRNNVMGQINSRR
jgi:hypothetical protein